MRGAPHKGLAWLMRRIRSRMFAATSGLPGRRRVLLENCKLVAKREDLRMQGSTRSKSGGNQSEKGNKKRAHRGSHHDLTTDRNPFDFRSDGVFSNHR